MVGSVSLMAGGGRAPWAEFSYYSVPQLSGCQRHSCGYFLSQLYRGNFLGDESRLYQLETFSGQTFLLVKIEILKFPLRRTKARRGPVRKPSFSPRLLIQSWSHSSSIKSGAGFLAWARRLCLEKKRMKGHCLLSLNLADLFREAWNEKGCGTVGIPQSQLSSSPYRSFNSEQASSRQVGAEQLPSLSFDFSSGGGVMDLLCSQTSLNSNIGITLWDYCLK